MEYVTGRVYRFWYNHTEKECEPPPENEREALHINSIMPEILGMIFAYLSDSDKDMRSIKLTCKKWNEIVPDQLDRSIIHKTLDTFRESLLDIPQNNITYRLPDGRQLYSACLWINESGELKAITQQSNSKTNLFNDSIYHKIFDENIVSKDLYTINVLLISESLIGESESFQPKEILYDIKLSNPNLKHAKALKFYIKKLIQASFNIKEDKYTLRNLCKYIPYYKTRNDQEDFMRWVHPFWFGVLTKPKVYLNDVLLKTLGDTKI